MFPGSCQGWHILKESNISDLQGNGAIYEHEKHKCKLFTVNSDDDMNFISFFFHTPATDDSGITHMLEHLILNGSQSYPVRSLFHEYHKRSYAHTMNASTSPETTSFYFASLNKIDFFNDMDVYLDAVFHPLLDEYGFMSECYHLEFENNDIDKPLKHCGVVYNEMLGSTSHTASILSRSIMKNLFPDCLCKYSGGGIPSDIRNTNHQKLKETYKQYYAPSNLYVFHYGNFPITEIMEKISNVINPLEYIEKKYDPQLFLQPKWEEPREIEVEVPLDNQNDETKQTQVIIKWITGHTIDFSLEIDYHLLVKLLCKSNDSPMYKAFIKTKIANRYSHERSGFSGLNSTFSIGFSGIDEAMANQIPDMIMKVLRDTYENGFDPENVLAVIHKMELKNRRNQLNIGHKCFASFHRRWMHDVDPFQAIETSKYFQRIKSILAENPNYFSDLIKPLMLDNTHKLTIITKPKKDFFDQINEQVNSDLEELKSRLSIEEKQNIIDRCTEMKRRQNLPNQVDLLPKFSREYLNEEYTKYVEPTIEEDGIVFFKQPTNEITYIELYSPVNIRKEEISMISHISMILNKIGAGDRNEEDFRRYIRRWLESFDASFHRTNNLDPDDISFKFHVHGSSFDEDCDKLFEIMNDIVSKPNFDEEKIKLVTINQHKIKRKVFGQGEYCIFDASAFISNSNVVSELTQGKEKIKFLDQVVNKDDWTELTNQIKNTYEEKRKTFKFNAIVHCSSEEQYFRIKEQLKALMNNLNTKDEIPVEKIIDLKNDYDQNNMFFKGDTQSGKTYIFTKSYNLLDTKYQIRSVLARILTNDFLHEAIRERLGAYHASATSQNGMFVMKSYRETNPMKILESCLENLKLVADGNINDEMVANAVISCFRSLDAPSLPHIRGSFAYCHKLPFEYYQNNRSAIFNVSKEQIIKEAKELCQSNWTSVVFASDITATPPSDFVVVDLKCAV